MSVPRPAVTTRRGLIIAGVLCGASVAGVATVRPAFAQPGSQETATPVSDWRPFTLPKPAAEEATTEDAAAATRDRINTLTRLPPQSDTLSTTAGLSHVVDHDWALEWASSGRIHGMHADLSAFLSAGEAGVEAPAARLSIVQPSHGWGLEVGDLFSEIRGLARGARAIIGSRAWHRPRLSVYLPNDRLFDTKAEVAYRDEVRFAHAVAGGEVSSGGSYVVHAAYVRPRFDVHISHRQVRHDDPLTSAEVMASVAIAKGLSLRAGTRWVTSPTERARGVLLSARVPLWNVIELSVEHNRNVGLASTDVSHAVGLQLLRGSIRFQQRFQWGDTEYVHLGGPFGLEQRQLQTSASFSPAKWATFSPQIATQWLPDGRAVQWHELLSAFTVTRTTQLQLYSSIPDVTDRRRLRSRLTQQFPRAFELLLDYGRISPFQSARLHVVDTPRLSVTVRKTWRTPTPVRGAEVYGLIRTVAGVAVPGAGVQLGPYLVFTDGRGAYRIPNVPSGTYSLSVSPQWLPAQFAADGDTRTVQVRGGGRHEHSLTVIPLDSLTGRVYHDRNDNGRYDDGEGQRGIPVQIGDEQITATDGQGAYRFSNLPPGVYLVRVNLDRMSDVWTAPTPAHTIRLDPERPATGVDFNLRPRIRPVVLQDLP